MKTAFSIAFLVIGVVLMGMCTMSDHALTAMRANRYPDPECTIGLIAGLASFLYGIRVATKHSSSSP